MKARRDRLMRALALSTDLWRLQAIRLSQIEAKLAELETAECDTLRALENPAIEPTLLLRRLQVLARLKQDAEAARAEQLQRTQALGRRAKLTEKLFDRAEDAWRRDQAAADLRKMIDRVGLDNVRAR